MNILIKSATIIDPQSEFHNTTQDILVENGVITKIESNLTNPGNYQEITLDNLHVSQGWFDSSVCFGEPGFEERDTIENGLKTAAASGFTAVAMNANTNPVIDCNADVTFAKAKAANQATSLLPVGALTVESKGVDLAELFDMNTAGAVAFYDYKKSISNPNLMKIALQYASNFNGLVFSFPQENKVVGHGVMNEHIISTKLGLKGIPALAEELQIVRDLFLLEYTGGKLHIPTISTQKSVELIREAKAKGLDVTCSVAIHNLYFTDEALTDFNTHFKVLPPLRTQTDCDALKAGLVDGTIDMVTSDHNPLDVEHKKVEFDHAAYGTIGLESAFGALQTLFNTEQTVKLLTQGKGRFGISEHSISVGNPLDATLFNPNTEYVFSKADMVSKSNNAIFENETLKGQVYGIIANNIIALK
ncbi:dihydroorotase [Aestuariibaculum suncheonense]|uniref:Dihydroorotase n=1 Tax=Aestuariibaculum suncheonense TaxID=1028745 RepID=A0A8J6UHP5_9FLAO|nr:dihydroorotase [Aestuariibaculum suncheonense]MBD0835934.1 dihydroorotase [Aestuariibaculum suncheonense]